MTDDEMKRQMALFRFSLIAPVVAGPFPQASKLGKAVIYVQNHHDTLMNYLLDDRCEISNNPGRTKGQKLCDWAESLPVSHIRGRCRSKRGEYSIVETAKANNLNMFQYLYAVLLYMPDYLNLSAGIEQLMPWSEFIKEQCSGLIDVESNVPENRIPLPHRQQRN